MVTFDAQPVLMGDLLELRPLKSEDFEALYKVACDPLIWEQHPQADRWERTVFEEFFSTALESRGALIAIDAGSGKVIGSSRFNGYTENPSQIEIGWTFLARSHWGGRYNGEMKCLMLSHAFAFVETVVFIIGPNNRRSQLAIEKIGAHRAGSRFESSPQEKVIYRLSRATYLKQI